jgi:hypothetical protein
MSLYNYDSANEFKVRLNALRAEDIYQKNHTTGEFERVGGGGGSTDLPYYLKPNSILMGAGVVNTVMDSDSIDVNGGTVGNAIGTSLRADSLIFGDNSGNSSFTKADIDALKYIQTGAMVSTKNESWDHNLVLYNPTTKNLCRASTFTLGPSPALNVHMSMYEISVQSSLTRYLRMTGGSGFQAVEGVLNAQLSHDRISFGSASGYKTLNRDDIIVTNNLKALVNRTPDSNSKMLIYDSTTKAFNFTDIPASVALPYYLYPSSIAFENTSTGSKLILNSLEGGSVISSSINEVNSVKINGRYGAIDIKNSTGVNTIYREDVAVTNNLKALTQSTQSYVVGYNPTSKAFSYMSNSGPDNNIYEFQPTNAGTWYRHGGGSSTTHGNGTLENATYYLTTAGKTWSITLAPSVAGSYYCPKFPLQLNQWLKINFGANGAQMRFSGSGYNSAAYFPMRFDCLAGVADPPEGAFDVFTSEDHVLEATVVKSAYVHKGTSYGKDIFLLVVKNITGGDVPNITPNSLTGISEPSSYWYVSRHTIVLIESVLRSERIYRSLGR